MGNILAHRMNYPTWFRSKLGRKVAIATVSRIRSGGTGSARGCTTRAAGRRRTWHLIATCGVCPIWGRCLWHARHLPIRHSSARSVNGHLRTEADGAAPSNLHKAAQETQTEEYVIKTCSQPHEAASLLKGTCAWPYGFALAPSLYSDRSRTVRLGKRTDCTYRNGTKSGHIPQSMLSVQVQPNAHWLGGRRITPCVALLAERYGKHLQLLMRGAVTRHVNGLSPVLDEGQDLVVDLHICLRTPAEP